MAIITQDYGSISGGVTFTSYTMTDAVTGNNTVSGLTSGDLILIVGASGNNTANSVSAVSGCSFLCGDNPIGANKTAIFQATDNTAVIGVTGAATYRYILCLKQ